VRELTEDEKQLQKALETFIDGLLEKGCSREQALVKAMNAYDAAHHQVCLSRRKSFKVIEGKGDTNGGSGRRMIK
jgi:hypothetical protein